jgi:hypothetical protein
VEARPQLGCDPLTKVKVCSQCDHVRLTTSFQKDSSKADGLRGHCRSCEATRKRLEDPRRTLLQSAKGRAKAKGVPFDLEAEDITVPTHCPALGIPLWPGVGKVSDHSPTLDRLQPAKGYVRGNVIVVSMRANRIKTDATIDELEAIASFFARHLVPSPRRKRTNPT